MVIDQYVVVLVVEFHLPQSHSDKLPIRELSVLQHIHLQRVQIRSALLPRIPKQRTVHAHRQFDRNLS